MADDQMGSDMPDDPNAAMPDDTQDSGFVVCIAMQPDGTYSVYAQDADDSQDDQGGGGDTEDQPQSADNIDDALMMAKQMFAQEGSEDEGSGEGGNEPLAPDDAKAVWNQMAAKKDKSRMMEQ